MINPLIVISNGMAKSGSTLLCRHTWMLVKNLFPDNGQRLLCNVINSGKIGGVANKRDAGMAFITNIRDQELDILSEIALLEGPLVVKTHMDTSPALVNALREGRIRMTFTHRDPRDMILSGMDHRILTQNSPNPSLQEYTSVLDSIASTRWWAQLSCNWVASGLPHVVRYSDLVSRPARELARMASYLDLQADAELLEGLIASELAEREFGKMRFNRGELHRYSKEMSAEDQALCIKELGGLITELGYEIEPIVATAPSAS